MSNMNDMALAVKGLRDAATAINEATEWLEVQFSNTETKKLLKKNQNQYLRLNKLELF